MDEQELFRSIVFWENVHVLIAMSLIVLLATLIVFIKVLHRNTLKIFGLEIDGKK